MDQLVVKDLYSKFLNTYDEATKNAIWIDHQSKFKNFWNNRVLKSNSKLLSDKEIDEIIKILDAKGKGNTKNDEAAGIAMIPQDAWRRMFNEFKQNPKLSKQINSIFTESSMSKRILLIDDLYKTNELAKNRLTGKSGNALNALLVAYDPFHNLSILSINDRVQLLAYLQHKNYDKYTGYTPGQKIVQSQTDIINALKEIGIDGNSRTISAFCYHSNFKYLWRLESSSKEHNNSMDNDVNDNQSFSSKTQRRYWLYAPGNSAYKWEEFYDQGIMGLGWNGLGDLSQYNSKEEIEKKLQQLSGDTTSKRNNATANYEFKNVMKNGDIIIVKKGRKELLGYGIVVSEYYYDTSMDDLNSCRKVDWKKKGEWKLQYSLPLKTLTDVTDYPTGHPGFDKYYKRLLSEMDITTDSIETSEFPSNGKQVKKHLNTILYGPPGTGKTYESVKMAAEIIKNHSVANYTEAKQIFNENLHDRIEFITFHQNYSYEDFIQGIRPDVENNKSLTFEKKDGVFKIIADRALQNLLASEKQTAPKKSFEAVFEEFFKPMIEGEVEEIEVKMKKVSFYITEVGNKSIDFRKASGGTAHTLSIATLKKMYEAGTVLDIQGLSSYYSPLLEKFLQLGKISENEVEKVNKNNYVIIIDEINRANISRVFGELITLIEPDKRSHGSIPLKSKLPSGDIFCVPSNLYLIGTMNTADKSIALLDIALRRRFDFISMYPKYEVNGHEIYDVEILRSLNEQIISSKGHDFQIGHSYFMKENNDLVKRMNNKVIPLLLEYFMNDDKEVRSILYKAGLEVETDSWPLRITGIRG